MVVARLIFVLVILLSSLFSTILKAESPAHALMLMSASMAPNNTGRPLPDGKNTPLAIKAFVMLRDSNGIRCAGTLIAGGCVLLARHCTNKFKGAVKIFNADFASMRKDNKIATSTNDDGKKWISWGKAGDPSTDISVMKLDAPLAKGVPSFPLSMLAKKRLEIPKNPRERKDFLYGSIISHGASTTQFKIEKGKIVYFENDWGLRRKASLQLLGYGKKTDRLASNGRGISTEGNVLWAAPGPHIGVQGDSGASLFFGGALHGVLSSVSGPEVKDRANEKERPKGRVYVNEVTSNRFAPIPDNRKEIVAAAKKLGCEAHTQAAIQPKIQRALASAKGTKSENGFSWNRFGGEAREVFESEVKKFAGISADETIEIEPLPADRGFVRFSVSVPNSKEVFGPYEFSTVIQRRDSLR